LKKEKEGLDTKLIGFQSASKDLDNLIGSQRSDKNKEGLRYNDTITDYTRPSPSIESNSNDLQNNSTSVSENEESTRSHRTDKNKEGLGYSVVPPSLAQVYSPPKKDMSWTGLPEFADDTITDYSRPSPIESNTSDLQNSNSYVSEHGESIDSIMSKPMI
nr:hypothetical protein [Tanacetum cinerariifolium]